MLEAIVPYSEAALIAWLGSRPDQFCSSRTARAMAMVAFRRGCHYRDAHAAVAGMACTASLATDRPKLGPHRVHLALQTATVTACWSLSLEKEPRTRREEETLVGRLLLNAMAEACGMDRGCWTWGCGQDETVENLRTVAPPPWQSLLLGEVETISQGQTPARPGRCPAGHLSRRVQPRCTSAISRCPRWPQISWGRLWNWRFPSPTSTSRRWTTWRSSGGCRNSARSSRCGSAERHGSRKNRGCFPMSTFVVGIDTLRRIAAPRYYGDDPAACEAAIELIASRGCRFLVFGRNLGTGFVSLRDLDLPPKLAASLQRGSRR